MVPYTLPISQILTRHPFMVNYSILRNLKAKGPLLCIVLVCLVTKTDERWWYERVCRCFLLLREGSGGVWSGEGQINSTLVSSSCPGYSLCKNVRSFYSGMPVTSVGKLIRFHHYKLSCCCCFFDTRLKISLSDTYQCLCRGQARHKFGRHE